jgi:hypothetical protein
MDSTLCIILVGYRISKIHEQPIPEQLSDIPIVALNNVGTHPLIGTHNVTVLFGVELRREFGGVHQVTKHHGQLAAFGCCWYGDFLSSWRVSHNRLRRSLVGLAGCCLAVFDSTCPRESSFICLYLRFMDIQEFILQIVEVGVIEVEAPF